jgi:hypothetical protein
MNVNEVEQTDPEQPRILARVVAKETTLQELELSLAAGKPTWSMSYPPDHD